MQAQLSSLGAEMGPTPEAPLSWGPGESWLRTQTGPSAAAAAAKSCLTLCNPIDGSPPALESLGLGGMRELVHLC